MSNDLDRLTVLQGKFAAYLSWSQPFLYALLRGLEPHCRNVIVCNRTENFDRFPIDNVIRVKTRYLVRPSGALLASMHIARDWSPDLLHAHFGWSGIRMLLLKQFLQVPLVTTFGGKDAGTQMHMPHYDRLYEILLTATDQIVCVSEDLKRQLVAHGIDPERIEVVRRGTNLDQFRFVDRSQRDPNRPLHLLMVGRLVEKKGHRYAFEALARLVERGHDLSLTVVGEGEDYRQIYQLRNELGLRDRVHFTGTTDHAGVRRLLNDADVFLHCSVTGQNGDCEGIPNVIVEAAATGLPVVGTRHGGIVETVRHQETGLLVAEADTDGLAEAIEFLALKRDARLEFGVKGAEFMRDQFDLQRQIERYTDIYERLVREYRTGEVRTPRNFVPDDFPKLIARTLQPGTDLRDFSLAELVEWVGGPKRLKNRVVQERPGFLGRCYNFKHYVPQQIKFPIKAVLGKSMAIIIDRMNAGLYRRSIVRLEKTDQSILEFFRNGGKLDALPQDWDADEVFERLPQLIELCETKPWTRGSHERSGNLSGRDDALLRCSARDLPSATRPAEEAELSERNL